MSSYDPLTDNGKNMEGIEPPFTGVEIFYRDPESLWDDQGRSDQKSLLEGLDPDMQVIWHDGKKVLVKWRGSRLIYITFPVQNNGPEEATPEETTALGKGEVAEPKRRVIYSDNNSSEYHSQASELSTSVQLGSSLVQRLEEGNIVESKQRVMDSDNDSLSYDNQTSGVSTGIQPDSSLVQRPEVPASGSCEWCRKAKSKCRAGGKGCTRPDQRRLPPSMRMGNKRYNSDPYEESATIRNLRRKMFQGYYTPYPNQATITSAQSDGLAHHANDGSGTIFQIQSRINDTPRTPAHTMCRISTTTSVENIAKAPVDVKEAMAEPMKPVNKCTPFSHVQSSSIPSDGICYNCRWAYNTESSHN